MRHRVDRREGLEAEHGVQGRLPPQPHRHSVVLARRAIVQQRTQIQAATGWYTHACLAVACHNGTNSLQLFVLDFDTWYGNCCCCPNYSKITLFEGQQMATLFQVFECLPLDTGKKAPLLKNYPPTFSVFNVMSTHGHWMPRRSLLDLRQTVLFCRRLEEDVGGRRNRMIKGQSRFPLPHPPSSHNAWK